MNLKLKTSSSTLKTLLLLLLWIAIGAGLRFTQLTGKSPWTDEFATMVFSLGNSFESAPQDKAIALDVLMQPLQPNPAAGIQDVIDRLLSEDHHPPLYFVLTHLWMQMFPSEGGLISLWGARSLPALFGVASIPAAYALSRVAFGSRLVGQLTAAMMAVSPYGIYIAQEARHYSLAILWVIASLTCLVVAAKTLQHGQPLSIRLGLSWVVINTLGIATHYFFTLTLCAEAIVLIAFAWRQIIAKPSAAKAQLSLNPHSLWWRIYAVAAGTAAGGLVWLLVWQHSYNSQMTDWIKSSDRSLLEWLNPVFQSLGTWIAMIYLLPVEASALPVVIASGGVMLIFLIWAAPILYRGLKIQWQQPSTRLAAGVLGGFLLGAIAIFFALSYGLGIDITRGARYNFVYFPAVIALVGASLAVCWQAAEVKSPGLRKNLFRTSGKKAVALILLMGLLSGLTVVSNLGYRKYYRPDLLVPIIQEVSSVPVLIATTHNTLVQTGEMMGIGWEFKGQTQVNPQFLLAHQDQQRCEGRGCRASSILQQALTELPRPLDLWLVNFYAPVELEAQKCLADTRSFAPIYGYDYKPYHCLAEEKANHSN
ncbi:MAG: glycosyltransferase [Aphanothece sp. CMT-3BRIN-NPC111]|jgi:uncharacterized membrane protein|nr:glycosyltransferase [Aphanothece sp. CMT-3BRIN-NPC111]